MARTPFASARRWSSSVRLAKGRRFFDQDVFAGLGPSGPVRNGGCRASRRRPRPPRSRPSKPRRRDPEIQGRSSLQVTLVRGPATRPGRDRRAELDQSKSRRYRPAGGGLEERPVGLVEDHPEADHAGEMRLDWDMGQWYPSGESATRRQLRVQNKGQLYLHNNYYRTLVECADFKAG